MQHRRIETEDRCSRRHAKGIRAAHNAVLDAQARARNEAREMALRHARAERDAGRQTQATYDVLVAQPKANRTWWAVLTVLSLLLALASPMTLVVTAWLGFLWLLAWKRVRNVPQPMPPEQEAALAEEREHYLLEYAAWEAEHGARWLRENWASEVARREREGRWDR